MHTLRKTKIIATIGPASVKETVLDRLISEGIDAARLNFSHGTHEEHGRAVKLVRRLAKKHGRSVAAGGGGVRRGGSGPR
jgi:pyruvate kinase